MTDRTISILNPNLHSDDEKRLPWRQWLLAGLAISLAILLAVGWLVPVLLQGGAQLDSVNQRRSEKAASIADFLTVQAGELNLDMGMVSVMYATPKYFQIANKANEAAQYEPDKYLVFFINEEIHHGELPLSVPTARLRVDGGPDILPAEDVQVLMDSYHHRSTLVRFPLVDTQGKSLIDDAVALDVVLSATEPAPVSATVSWDLPIQYPPSLLQGPTLTMGTLLALVAGLLAALSPCLIQLTACYLSTLAGVGVRQEGEALEIVRGRVVRTALLFVGGFTLVYTLAGFIAGLVGQTIQSSGLLVKWSEPLAIASGLMLIGMGLWVAVRARAPMVCRLPMPSFMRLSRRAGVFGPIVLGFAFALGCATCFSGALFAALLLYLGTAALPLHGAGILFLFSLGIAIPYLLAAATLSRSLPQLERLERWSPYIGLASSVVIMAFGVMMLTGNFHAVSDEVYKWMRWTALVR